MRASAHPFGSSTPLRRASDRVAAGCHALRGHRLPWLATAFGTGIGVYFALPVEPGGQAVAALAVAFAALLALAWLGRGGAGLLALFAAAALLGLLVGQSRTALVAGPVLEWRYYGAIEGRVVDIDRSASGAPRLTLDRVRLDRFAPAETPRRVRISLQDLTGIEPVPGQRVMTTGHLSPPAGPTEPGGFDFQRHAWFQELGAVGYTRVPLLRAALPENGTALLIARIRAAIGNGLRDRMPGQAGQVAAAITTGDRAGLSDEVTADLRASNLAHLLAISGLHMGLLVGFVFWLTRGGLALIPSIALTQPTRSWAAATALPFALFYLFLSGGSVATQRAFVMAAVMLGAILLGARALSIRSVAIAAILILLWRPEALTGPGFQMSFAATGALVLAFGALSRRGRGGWMRGWKGAFVSLLLSSVVAGAATAPFAALHFNRVGQFGVLANLLAVPAMGTLVMPMLLIALLLWPLGLEGPPLALAGYGIEWILLVAERVADLPGSVTSIPAPTWQALPLLGLGMAVIGAARSWLPRGAGVILLCAAAGFWALSARPHMLVSDDGRLIGVITDRGRWLSRDKGAGFVAEAWLENDGDDADQPGAASRVRPDAVAGIPLHYAETPSRTETAVADCLAEPGLLILPDVRDEPVPGCDVIDTRLLSRTGAISLTPGPGGGLVRTTTRNLQGARPWVPSPSD